MSPKTSQKNSMKHLVSKIQPTEDELDYYKLSFYNNKYIFICLY